MKKKSLLFIFITSSLLITIIFKIKLKKKVTNRKKFTIEQKIDFPSLMEKVIPSLVFIRVRRIFENSPFFHFYREKGSTNDINFEDFFSNKRKKFKVMGHGSGFVLKKNGIIATNYHVIAGAEKIIVQLNNEESFNASIIGADVKSDIALLKIEKNNLPTLEFASHRDSRVGDYVLSFGSPFGLNNSVSLGIISALNRGDIGVNEYENYIQTDASINPGNSGGPLIDRNGKLIGMNTALASLTGGFSGIGFAIPVDIIKHVTEHLIKFGRVTRGFLGIAVKRIPIKDINGNIENDVGLIIKRIEFNSTAMKGGLKKNDIILKYNGQKIENSYLLKNLVAKTPPGKNVSITIIRNKKIIKINIIMGKLSSLNRKIKDIRNNQFIMERLGLNVINSKVKNHNSTFLGKVTKVIPESPADFAGIQEGDIILEINFKKVISIDKFFSKIKESLTFGKVTFLIERKNSQFYSTLSPTTLVSP